MKQNSILWLRTTNDGFEKGILMSYLILNSMKADHW